MKTTELKLIQKLMQEIEEKDKKIEELQKRIEELEKQKSVSQPVQNVPIERSVTELMNLLQKQELSKEEELKDKINKCVDVIIKYGKTIGL